MPLLDVPCPGCPGAEGAGVPVSGAKKPCGGNATNMLEVLSMLVVEGSFPIQIFNKDTRRKCAFEL
jgi:hypothetical protein